MGTLSGHIYELIVLCLDGEQTPMEGKELEAWIEADDTHRRCWEEYVALHRKLQSLKRPCTVDVEQKLREVKKRRRICLSRKVTTWVAVMALPLCLGVWLFLQAPQAREHRIFSDVARPGNEKAILKMANNTFLILGGERDTLIRTENGACIVADSQHVVSYYVNRLRQVSDGKPQWNQLIVPRGGEYRLELSDGTRVWLNASSTLTYPQVFVGTERRVQLEGEAFFEVQSDTAHPFIVSTSRMDIEVLGTSFNVSAYEDEEVAHATLVKGSIKAQSAGRGAMVLKPGEQACVGNDRMSCHRVDTRQYTSWIDGEFMFNNTALEEISRQISRWYNVDIFFANERVKRVCFTGAMYRFEPLEVLIQMIESTSDVYFCVKGKTIVISESQ